MTGDRPFWGVLLMLGFCVLAPMGDALAKLLGEAVPLGQLLLVRFAAQAAILTPLVLAADGGVPRLSPRAWRLTAIRTGLHIAGVGLMFMSLRYLPLADAVAIAFVMPFIMLLLGHFVLGEIVGRPRIIACAVGFAGTLMVIQPNFAEVGAPALMPLGVAVIFALFMLVTRQVAKEAGAVPLQCVSGWIALVILIPAMLIGEVAAWPELSLVAPSRPEWVMLAALGALGTVAHLMMTWSLRFAPTATLAPMQYLEIPIATLIGFAVFGALPNGLAAAGIVVTMAAGLYIVYRENKTHGTEAA